MTVLVLRHDFQPSSYCESKKRNERILESNAVHIVIARTLDQLPRFLITVEEGLKNRRLDLLAWFDLLGGPSPRGRCGWRYELANEPSSEPAGSNLLNRRPLPPVQGSCDRREVNFVCDEQVLKTLANAPGFLSWPPVELCRAESFRQTLGSPVGVVKLRYQPARPSR